MLPVLYLIAFPLSGLAQPIDSAAIDRTVQEAMRYWQVPGVAVAIVRDDAVIYLKGFGVKEIGKKNPVTPDTLFPLASCTKAFTTTAMAILVDEGKMGWDDPVRKHVEFFHLSDPSADALVTLRDLVSHRTGVGSHELLWYRSPWSQEEIIRRIGKVKLDYPFRSTFHYQTTMFTTAGWAVSKASKSTWPDFVQKQILNPLEMNHTNFTTTVTLKSPDHASPHTWRAREPASDSRRPDALAGGLTSLNPGGKLQVIPWYEIDKPEPAGSVNSCARDLAQWVRFQLGDGSFKGKRLVSAKNLGETHTPQTIIRLEGNVRDMNPDTLQISYGMGWVIQDYRGQLLVSHAGAIDGFRAHLILVPKAKLGIVLLNNLDHTQMNLALSNTLIDQLLGLPKKDWNAYVGEQVRKQEAAAQARYRERQASRKSGTKPSRELSAYAGTYEEPAYGTATISLENGSLVWKWSTFADELEHFQDDTFTIQNLLLGNPRVTFTVGPDGDVATIKVLDVLNVEFKKIKSKTSGR
jgi:CubicO group peptidase (beta-lactamase class C family)